jgi:hypothetical protein
LKARIRYIKHVIFIHLSSRRKLFMVQTSLEKLFDRLAPHELPIETVIAPEEARTTSQRVAYLLSGAHESLPSAASLLDALKQSLPAALHSAFAERDAASLLDIHKALFAIYEVSFSNPLSPAAMHERSPWLMHIRDALETAWMNDELPSIEHRLPAQAELESVERVCEWFVNQAQEESPRDREVVDFLETRATIEQFSTFILADAHLNYRFYDALALAQLHYSERVKAEIAQHMWDECGCGVPDKAHTRQFTRALLKLDLPRPVIPIWEDWRPYAGYNLYLCFGLNRRHYFKALGSLAMPELFDPGRDRAVVSGLERLGFQGAADFEYYYSHIGGDEEHGERWLSHVIGPIVEAQPEASRELAIGGALRMQAMRRYNEYLAAAFGLKGQ